MRGGAVDFVLWGRALLRPVRVSSRASGAMRLTALLNAGGYASARLLGARAIPERPRMWVVPGDESDGTAFLLAAIRSALHRRVQVAFRPMGDLLHFVGPVYSGIFHEMYAGRYTFPIYGHGAPAVSGRKCGLSV